MPLLEDMSREELIAEVNVALTKLKQFSAKFSQTDQNGQSVSGQLTVLRPGRLRFDYNPPSALKIIADGNNVAVIDERLGTRDLYSIGLTPLKFCSPVPLISVANLKSVTFVLSPIALFLRRMTRRHSGEAPISF